jgi:integrase
MKLTTFLASVYVNSRPIQQNTREQFLVGLRHWERFLDRPPRTEDLDERKVAEFLRWYAEGNFAAGIAPRSPATVNGRRKEILALWAVAIDEGLVDRAPNKRRVPRWKEPRRAPDAWTLEELARLLRHLERLRYYVGEIPAGHYWPSIVLAIYSTGCRISALLSTRTADVSLSTEPAWLRVRAEAMKTYEDKVFQLTPQAARAIALHYDPERDLVWPWPYGKAYFFRKLRGEVKAAGLRLNGGAMGLTHKFRRTHVTTLARVAGIEAASRSAGHKSLAMTIDHYLDPTQLTGTLGIEQLPEIR